MRSMVFQELLCNVGVVIWLLWCRMQVVIVDGAEPRWAPWLRGGRAVFSVKSLVHPCQVVTDRAFIGLPDRLWCCIRLMLLLW